MGFEVLMEVYKNIWADGILSRVFWKLHIRIQQNILRRMSEESNLNNLLYGQRNNLEVNKSLFSIS
jgi:hypothetical protein